jgi:AcrR family transcriptional regulator
LYYIHNNSLGVVHFNKKYSDIVAAARELFWKHGFRRISVEEICRKAGVSKMTFYKHFSNKTELAIEIIRRIFDESMKAFHDMMQSDIPFEEKMQIQLQMKLEGTQDISEEFVKDVFGDTNSELHKYWEERASESIAEVIQYYREAQQKGWLRRDVKIDFILYVINKFFEFANDDTLISKYSTMQELIVEINKFLLYGILPYEKKTDE